MDTYTITAIVDDGDRSLLALCSADFGLAGLDIIMHALSGFVAAIQPADATIEVERTTDTDIVGTLIGSWRTNDCNEIITGSLSITRGDFRLPSPEPEVVVADLTVMRSDAGLQRAVIRVEVTILVSGQTLLSGLVTMSPLLMAGTYRMADLDVGRLAQTEWYRGLDSTGRWDILSRIRDQSAVLYQQHIRSGL
jgi:hypothetical protein